MKTNIAKKKKEKTVKCKYRFIFTWERGFDTVGGQKDKYMVVIILRL